MYVCGGRGLGERRRARSRSAEGALAFVARPLLPLRLRCGASVAGGLSNRTVLYEITPVPEPGTWLLMGLGLAGVAAVARRRRA